MASSIDYISLCKILSNQLYGNKYSVVKLAMSWLLNPLNKVIENKNDLSYLVYVDKVISEGLFSSNNFNGDFIEIFHIYKFISEVINPSSKAYDKLSDQHLKVRLAWKDIGCNTKIDVTKFLDYIHDSKIYIRLNNNCFNFDRDVLSKDKYSRMNEIFLNWLVFSAGEYNSGAFILPFLIISEYGHKVFDIVSLLKNIEPKNMTNKAAHIEFYRKAANELCLRELCIEKYVCKKHCNESCVESCLEPIYYIDQFMRYFDKL